MLSAHKTVFATVVTLCAGGLGLPRASYALTGCTNAHLTGTYSVQVGNSSIMALANTLNADPAATTPAPPPPTGGFGDNPNSLGGSMPGLGRFFLNGEGAVTGQMVNASGFTTNASVGTYSVNYDCTATISLTTGQRYNAIVADGGNRVLFVETDTAGIGIVGVMQRSANSCAGPVGSPLSFAFSSSGLQKVTPTSTGTGTGTGTGTTTTPASRFALYSTIGSVTLNNDGSFSLRGWTTANGASQSVTTEGRYTISTDCSLRLTFNSPTAAGAPTSLRGFLSSDSTGLFSVQADTSTTITGELIVQ